MSPKKTIVGSKTESSKTPSSNNLIKYIGIAVVSLALIGLIFSSFYSGPGGSSGGLVFGRYGDKEIRYTPDNSFGQAVESAMANYNASVEGGDEFYSFIRFIAWQEAFSSIVFNTAIAYHLDRSGYQPSSRAVDRGVIQTGPYRTNGEFDESKYLATSQARREAVRELIREQLTLSAWGRDVLDSQYHSKAQLDFLWAMRADRNTYEYVSIPFSDFPTESVLEYAKANSGLFSRLPVSRITVPDEETARTVSGLYGEQRQQMNAFADLAREYSQDAYADGGGSMGPTDYYLLSELLGAAAADEVFAAAAGDIAGPFDTQYGWMLVRVDGEVEPLYPEQRVEDVRSYMLQNEVGIVEDMLIARAGELRLKALSAGSFSSALAAEGYEVATTEPFPVNFAADGLLGGSPENSGDPVLSGASSSDEFWEKVVPLDRIGEISSPVVLNGFIALFSLVSSEEPEEMLSYWDALVDYEISVSRQNDFRTAVLNTDSKLFQNNFISAYERIFGTQG